jgi:xylulokinase
VSLLAVDMGSSSCKAVAFAADGRVLAQSSRSYSPKSPRPGWAELSAEDFWNAFVEVTHTVAKHTGNDKVLALGISSHGETIVPVDSQQRPVAAAILNIDNRAVDQAERLAKQMGRQPVFEITGLTVHAMYPLPKILWLREQQPDIFSSTTCFLALPSYLLTRLHLPAYVDYSLAARYLAFDIHQRTWSADILSSLELATCQFPVARQAGTIAGLLSSESASQLGLPIGTPVVLGGHDQPCGALGVTRHLRVPPGCVRKTGIDRSGSRCQPEFLLPRCGRPVRHRRILSVGDDDGMAFALALLRWTSGNLPVCI